MTYLVISDIHANLEALEATLQHAGPHDAILLLGDLVGYGADPNAVIERVRDLQATTIIRGNHDKVGAGVDSVEAFNQLAKHAIAWTASVLTAPNRDWLAALPAGPVNINSLVQICHGSPFDEDAYIFDELDARRAFSAAERTVCLFGHTHVPAVYRFDTDLRFLGPPRGSQLDVAFDQNAQYLINCGAVGQPRDGDARAAYGVLDTDARTLAMVRVPYDLATAQAKIVAAGLPEVLAHRLGVGR